MKNTVENMTGRTGRAVPNQFIIETQHETPGVLTWTFQSYETIIATYNVPGKDGGAKGFLTLDRNKWDYSPTTSRYRNQFTGLTTAETKAGIKDGSIKLADLNE
jgi:hypothetical protein